MKQRATLKTEVYCFEVIRSCQWPNFISEKHFFAKAWGGIQGPCNIEDGALSYNS